VENLNDQLPGCCEPGIIDRTCDITVVADLFIVTATGTGLKRNITYNSNNFDIFTPLTAAGHKAS